MASKKLIEFGWDVPTIGFARENLKRMEAQPFDGVVMRLADQSYPEGVHSVPTVNAFTSIFNRETLPQNLIDQCLEDARHLRSDKLTDNFLLMWCSAAEGYDWFNEADWATTEQCARMFARIARAGGMKGILFDPEPYSASHLWQHSWLLGAYATQRSFDEYAVQIRKRGAQFMQIMQDEFPDITILSLFLLNYMPLGKWKPYTGLEARKADLVDSSFGLLVYWVAGMLDVAAPNVRILDGNEHAYYYDSPREHGSAAKGIRINARDALVDFAPGIGTAFDAHIGVSCATYYDYCLKPELFDAWFEGRGRAPFFGKFLNQADRLRWLEHNLYYALKTTDEYVWAYSEVFDWWRADVPTDVEAAYSSARRKAAQSEPLGFDEALQTAFHQARLEAEHAHAHA